jgi:hypothetical protein
MGKKKKKLEVYKSSVESIMDRAFKQKFNDYDHLSGRLLPNIST